MHLDSVLLGRLSGWYSVRPPFVLLPGIRAFERVPTNTTYSIRCDHFTGVAGFEVAPQVASLVVTFECLLTIVAAESVGRFLNHGIPSSRRNRAIGTGGLTGVWGPLTVLRFVSR